MGAAGRPARLEWPSRRLWGNNFELDARSRQDLDSRRPLCVNSSRASRLDISEWLAGLAALRRSRHWPGARLRPVTWPRADTRAGSGWKQNCSAPRGAMRKCTCTFAQSGSRETHLVGRVRVGRSWCCCCCCRSLACCFTFSLLLLLSGSSATLKRRLATPRAGSLFRRLHNRARRRRNYLCWPGGKSRASDVAGR